MCARQDVPSHFTYLPPPFGIDEGCKGFPVPEKPTRQAQRGLFAQAPRKR